MFNNLIEFSICSCSLRSIEGLSFILITCPWEICWNCPSQRPLLFCQIWLGSDGRLEISVTWRWRRSLTDTHANCSSFISLGNSAKNRIITFTLNSRLAPSKDGLKKTQNIKTKETPNKTFLQIHFPKKFKSWNISLKIFRIFHSGGTGRVLQGARGQVPILPGGPRDMSHQGGTYRLWVSAAHAHSPPSPPRNYMKTKSSLSMENKLLICIKVYFIFFSNANQF